jgi:hypothetical protein
MLMNMSSLESFHQLVRSMARTSVRVRIGTSPTVDIQITNDRDQTLVGKGHKTRDHTILVE